MSTQPKAVRDFDPQGQAPGPIKANPLAQGIERGSPSGGSAPTSQAHRPHSQAMSGTSAPPDPKMHRP